MMERTKYSGVYEWDLWIQRMDDLHKITSPWIKKGDYTSKQPA